MYHCPHDKPLFRDRCAKWIGQLAFLPSDVVPLDARGGHAMGRGRAKAKQTKVARELKYYSPNTDLSALERELHGSPRLDQTRFASADTEDDDEDDYGRWVSGQH